MKKVLFPILALVLALGLSLPMAMPAVADPDPGLVGLWHLDEGSGAIAYDSSGNANDGTISGATWAGSANAKFGDALSFDGVNDYVDCGTGIAITTAITVETWIKPSAFTNYDAIVANFVWPTNPEGFSFRVMANGKLVWRAVLSGNNAYSITSNAALETGNWYHVAVTHNSSYTRLYINGTLDKEETPGGTIINLGKALKIGWDDYAADRVFNGTIDEVRIWDEALTAEQVAGSAECGIVIQKEMSEDDADLGDTITTTIEVVAAEADVEVVDTLPGELRYIPDTLSVTGGTATCEGSEHEITCTLDENVPYTITFDAQVTSAEADDNTVTNTAEAGDASASAELTIYPYEGFTKEILVGDEVVPLGTDVHWLVGIVLVNVPGDEIETMENVVVKDRLGGDLELHCTVESMGVTTWYTTGKTEKVHLTWDLEGDLGTGESAWLALDISTDVNPGKGKTAPHQEYTEEGLHDLNSGAVVKFVDSEGTGFQLSAHTAPLEVEATDTADELTYGVLCLAEKDPSDWSIMEGGACGILAYDLAETTFDFGFVASGLEATTGYSLIYYADFEDRMNVWGGNNPGALIATGTSDPDGVLFMFGSPDLGMDLPHPDDANGDITNWDYSGPPDYYDHATGAKIWLVPSDCYDGVNKVTAWQPTRFLFETDLIWYDDTNWP